MPEPVPTPTPPESHPTSATGWGRVGGDPARIGLLVGAAVAVLLPVASRFDLTSGRARSEPHGPHVLSVEPVVGIIGAVICAVLIAAALAPWGWSRLVGVFAVTLIATTSGIEVLRGRISQSFLPDERTALEAGGLMLTLAFWGAVVVVAAVLIALRRRALDVAPIDDEALAAYPLRADGLTPARSPLSGTLGMALSLAGIVAPALSGLAIALSLNALGQINAARGRLGGRVVALAGVAVGVIGLSLLVGVLGIGALVLSPTA